MIGLFIGSFNPITKAHIDICLKLKNKFKKIVLVPVNSNDKNLIDINYRIEMINILKSKYSFIDVSDIMKDYSYLNYRIIDLLKEKYSDFNIIMGSDLLLKFNSYDNYEYLLNNYQFTIIPRDNIDTKKIIIDNYNKYQDRFDIIDFSSDISSTKVRHLLKNNQLVKSMLNNDILNYIQDNHLY